MMTVFTFLGPSWMMRSYSIPSSAMSQPHWYNTTDTAAARGGQTDLGVGDGPRPAGLVVPPPPEIPRQPRPVTRKDHFGTLQHIIQTGRMKRIRWLAYEKWKATTIVKEYGKLFYKLLDEGVIGLKTSTFFFWQSPIEY